MKIGIVGAGPAGSYLAHLLAGGGVEVLLFDHKAPWEKPCGGGLSPKALEEFGFLNAFEYPRAHMDKAVVIAPSGRRLVVQSDEPITVFSRRDLNEALLRMARDAGAQFFSERITNLEEEGDGWTLDTSRDRHRVGFLVGADGARSLVRRSLGKMLEPADYSICLGYYCRDIPLTHMRMKFMEDLPGYLWVMPRADHASVGVWTLWGRAKADHLNRRLRDFVKEFHPEAEMAPRPDYVVSNPAIRSRERLLALNSRQDGALVGDAAGFADAITGEGLYYALKSSQLLAESLLEGRPEHYQARLNEGILKDLAEAARLHPLFYRRGFAERVIRLAIRKERVAKVIKGLIFGREEYAALPKIMRRELLLESIRTVSTAPVKLLSRWGKG